MKLKHPFKSQTTGQEIADITLTRQPKARDLYRAHAHSQNVLEQTGFLIALLSGQSPDDIAELHASDFMELGKEVGDFLGLSPASTGATS
jgi:hypothetical protein